MGDPLVSDVLNILQTGAGSLDRLISQVSVAVLPPHTVALVGVPMPGVI